MRNGSRQYQLQHRLDRRWCVVGFSVTAFIFRIGREAKKRDERFLYWLPPADFLLLGSLAVTLIGVFVLPILGAGLSFALYALGLSLVLLAAYPFALAGHYEILFGQPPKEEDDDGVEGSQASDKVLRKDVDEQTNPRPQQETNVLWVTLGLVILYLVVVIVREVR